MNREDMSTPRWWWWLRFAGPGLVFVVAGLVFAAAGKWTPAIIGVGAGLAMVTQSVSALYLFRSGFFRGRMSAFVEVERTRRRLYLPRPDPHPNPWDPIAEWPADDDERND